MWTRWSESASWDHLDALEGGNNIRTVILWALDLMEELGSDVANVDSASSVWLFLKGTRAIRKDRGDGEANVLGTVKQSLEAGIVASNNIRGALNEVTSDQRTRDLVKVCVPVPPLPPQSSSNRGCSICYTATDENVSATKTAPIIRKDKVSHCFLGPVTPGENSLCGDGIEAPILQIPVEADILKCMPLLHEPVNNIQDLITLHPGDFQVKSLHLDLRRDYFRQRLSATANSQPT